MRSKEIAARMIKVAAKPKPTKPAFFAKNLPKEVKIVGALLLMLAALYAFHLASQPSFLKPQTNAATEPVVSESGQQQPAATTAADKETKQQASAQTETAQAQQQAPQPKLAATSSTTPLKIISPQKGSTQSPGFSVNIEVSSEVLTCYYSLKDDGKLTWDRRMKPCRAELPVSADHCKTAGANTCQVSVEAWSAAGNLLGTDSASYGIQ